MDSPVQSSKLAEAFAKAQGQFKTPRLNREATIKNASGAVLYTTRYADIQECIDCIKKPLSDNGLSFVQTVEFLVSPKEMWVLKLMLLHSSGDSVQSILPLNVTLSAQQLGGILTYYKRYQISAFFGLAADYDDDGNTAEGKGHIVDDQDAARKKKAAEMTAAAAAEKKRLADEAHKQAQSKAAQPPAAPVSLLEQLVAFAREHEIPNEEMATTITRVVGRAAKSTDLTPQEITEILKYLTMKFKG